MRLTWTRCIVGTLVLAFGGLALYAQRSGAQQAAAYQLAVPQPQSPEYFAGNLGIYYRLVPYYPGGYPGPYGAPAPNGGYAAIPQQAPPSYGARLTRYPVPGSPAAFLGLEPGDMIVTLDNMAIFSPNDVLAHRFQTSMLFVNVRTGLPQPGQVYIP